MECFNCLKIGKCEVTLESRGKDLHFCNRTCEAAHVSDDVAKHMEYCHQCSTKATVPAQIKFFKACYLFHRACLKRSKKEYLKVLYDKTTEHVEECIEYHQHQASNNQITEEDLLKMCKTASAVVTNMGVFMTIFGA